MDNFWDNSPPHWEIGNNVAGTDIFQQDNTVVINDAPTHLNTETFTIPTFP